MATFEVSFKTKEAESSKKVSFTVPDTTAGLVEKYGEESVFGAAKGAYVIGLQAYLRRHFDKSDEELQNLANSWNPNERAPAVKQTAMEKATSALGNLSAEERKELINKLRALQQAG